MSRSSTECDAILGLCRSERRRIVLSVLAEREGPVSIETLGEEIAERSDRTRRTTVSDEGVAKIETSLHHVHLPKVEDAGVGEYDAEHRSLKPTARFDEMAPHLSAVLDVDSDRTGRNGDVLTV